MSSLAVHSGGRGCLPSSLPPPCTRQRLPPAGMLRARVAGRGRRLPQSVSQSLQGFLLLHLEWPPSLASAALPAVSGSLFPLLPQQPQPQPPLLLLLLAGLWRGSGLTGGQRQPRLLSPKPASSGLQSATAAVARGAIFQAPPEERRGEAVGGIGGACGVAVEGRRLHSPSPRRVYSKVSPIAANGA